jgi:hypothetical protein
MNIQLRRCVPLLALLAAGCATHIYAKDETIKPTKVTFRHYQDAVMKPLAWGAESDVDDKVVRRVEEVLLTCMKTVFTNIKPFDAAEVAGMQSVLVIEPSIVDMKKVNVAQRIFFGAMAGSSAGLLKVTFVGEKGDEVLAEPVFYAKANAWASPFGIEDNAMLSRLPNEACDYARYNY